MNLLDYLKAERGRTRELAAAAGMSPAYLSQIANGRRPCPVGWAMAIEAACDFHVTRKELCPDKWRDVWPELSEEGPPSIQSAPPAPPAWPALERRNTATPRIGSLAPRPAVQQQEEVEMTRSFHSTGRSSPLRPPPGILAASGESLEGEVLRLAAQAAEAQCRKQKMLPMDAALAVVAAYRAAREQLSASPPVDGAARS